MQVQARILLGSTKTGRPVSVHECLVLSSERASKTGRPSTRAVIDFLRGFDDRQRLLGSPPVIYRRYPLIRRLVCPTSLRLGPLPVHLCPSELNLGLHLEPCFGHCTDAAISQRRLRQPRIRGDEDWPRSLTMPRLSPPTLRPRLPKRTGKSMLHQPPPPTRPFSHCCPAGTRCKQATVAANTAGHGFCDHSWVIEGRYPACWRMCERETLPARSTGGAPEIDQPG